ncbi:arabinosyltransferase domain-containing protein [Corynebacterium sp. HMSC034A01]|uniref:arabinosyltransferase domain-containing protein n=1 Tax=Corynebacterium sp. HMSC034A01 TaxID=1739295 RepID=UPI001FEFF5E8|nr:arabinosyltransferase domain-containing protein [Corynebacterium sp. HMSC034A01]
MKRVQTTATVAGLIAFVLLLLVPFLPVKQTESSVSWPQNGSVASVNAPLISLAPQQLDVTVPLSAIDELREGQSLLLGTLPEGSPKASDRGFFITSPDGGLVVSSLNEVLLQLTPAQVAKLPDDAKLEAHLAHDLTTVEIPGTDYSEEDDEEDYRPQLTGIYTELKDEQKLIDAGLSANVDINSRFTSQPTLIKTLAMVLGLISALISLAALRKLDRPAPRLRRQGLKPLDGLVAAVLGFWHIFGANTSDDGFLLTMARVAANTDYMANYYRWYGVPEAPFGSPFYDLLALMSQVTTASMWMRLPALFAGLGTWWLLSREILPKLGPAVANRRVAHWTAALVFLTFWLPYNNGTRPEPIIAFGLMATWALFERAMETDRLVPAAWGTVVAALTLACGPTGLAAVGVFLISLPWVLGTIGRREAKLASIAPFMGAGMAVMVPVFKDQTLATVLEATAVRSEVGPAMSWFEEWSRYSVLFEQTVDGSLARRFPMFVLLLCIGLTLWWFARGGERTKTAQRMMLIIGLSTFFLMFTPTKWTHHFGIYAGLGAAIAAYGSVVLSRIALQSKRNRSFATAAVLFLLALTLAGWNGWWYVSSYAVPWWDRTPQLKAVEFNTIVLAIALVVFVVGVVQSMRPPKPVDASRWAGVMSAPIAVAAALIVALSCLTFVKSFISQAPNYSVGMGNVRTFAGDRCAQGADVLLEEDTNDAFLSPIDGVPLGRSLDSGDNYGFHPDGVPAFIASENADTSDSSNQQVQSDDTADVDPGSDEAQSTSRVNTQGNRPRSMRGVNGSTVRLPFGLDYTRVPVLGTFEDEPTQSAKLETSWFDLPSDSEERPLLVTSVAGRIKHHDINGVEQEGNELELQYGRKTSGGVQKLGAVEMLDQGPTPQWRNLRYPIADLPDEADVVRLVAKDTSLAEKDWLAVTPLRNPKLVELNTMFDSETPGLLDWAVAFQYPCQRPFYHHAGVDEIPEFRIMPDAPGKQQLSGFMDFLGGGSLAPVEAVNTSYEVPGYLKGDWQRDWGSVAKYERRTNSAGEAPALAQVDLEETTRSGLYTPGPMKVRDPEE